MSKFGKLLEVNKDDVIMEVKKLLAQAEAARKVSNYKEENVAIAAAQKLMIKNHLKMWMVR